MYERLPEWIKKRWVLYALSAVATLLVGLLILLVFMRGFFASTLARQGARAYKDGDYGTAAAKYSAALSYSQKKQHIYQGYGESLMALGDYDTAVEVLGKGIDRFGGAEALYLLKAKALVADGSIGQAVDFLDSLDSYIIRKLQDDRPGDLNASPQHGKYSRAQKVTITQRPGETIYYTLNGSDPTLNSAVYKEPINVSTSSVLTAISVSADGMVSPRLRLEYEINNANEAIQFTDAKIERMVRASLDRPYGSIYAAQLLSLTDLYNDGIDGSIRSLKDLEYMPSLISLRINDELLIDDYSPLANLHDLEILSISGCALSDGDLTYLNGLTKLKELCIASNQITSLDGLDHLLELEFLDASENDLESTTAIADFPRLKWLYLAGNRILRLDGLVDLSELLTLDLSNNYISDVSALTGLTKLTDLYLANNTPKNIKKLSVLPALTHMDLSGCGLDSLSGINDFKVLRSLTAGNNQISSLTTLTLRLEELYIGQNPLTDIASLQKQTELQSLDVSSTQITDISCLGSLQSLHYLDISNTGITDANCLKGNANLEYLICPAKCATNELADSVEIVVP